MHFCVTLWWAIFGIEKAQNRVGFIFCLTIILFAFIQFIFFLRFGFSTEWNGSDTHELMNLLTSGRAMCVYLICIVVEHHYKSIHCSNETEFSGKYLLILTIVLIPGSELSLLSTFFFIPTLEMCLFRKKKLEKKLVTKCNNIMLMRRFFVCLWQFFFLLSVTPALWCVLNKLSIITAIDWIITSDRQKKIIWLFDFVSPNITRAFLRHLYRK